ncbi:hypothetical protein COU20_02695 [Candidatus Kaiserbacteria bacterium CG10_big_fil_rev_8_21_14_0_10_59_10]|uniref:Bacterial spore germination immunoglobulin-like domain-containing protein n=1 Tax=Candidatus Kaiserbacteria bacterium CG10_big_fil_rev_8_21_14_0_10_59_10 TaxID=1974612 RepID=A0A2H0U7K8_9BACT|nr:MAG: hypothetical protein COU20_02695 [Candidatus Kaiserbacteria bacterium CG10_big_fil_rev_8_21_14_0_10_59_10]
MNEEGTAVAEDTRSSFSTWLSAAAVIAIIAAAVWFFWPGQTEAPVEQITWHNAGPDMVQLDLIYPGVTVLPQFTVTGQARGMWFFEADFPIEVLDMEGNRIAMEIATAEGEWMTEEFVPFSATFDLGEYSGPATLVLHRSNASGLPEHDASMSVPIVVQ